MEIETKEVDGGKYELEKMELIINGCPSVEIELCASCPDCVEKGECDLELHFGITVNRKDLAQLLQLYSRTWSMSNYGDKYKLTITRKKKESINDLLEKVQPKPEGFIGPGRMNHEL